MIWDILSSFLKTPLRIFLYDLIESQLILLLRLSFSPEFTKAFLVFDTLFINNLMPELKVEIIESSSNLDLVLLEREVLRSSFSRFLIE